MQEEGRVILHIYIPQEEAEVVSAFYQDAGEGYGPSRTEYFTLSTP